MPRVPKRPTKLIERGAVAVCMQPDHAATDACMPSRAADVKAVGGPRRAARLCEGRGQGGRDLGLKYEVSADRAGAR